MTFAEFVQKQLLHKAVNNMANASPATATAHHAIVGMVTSIIAYDNSTSRGAVRETLGAFVTHWEGLQQVTNNYPAMPIGHAAGFERPGVTQWSAASKRLAYLCGRLLSLSAREVIEADDLDAVELDSRRHLMAAVAENLWVVLHFHGLTLDQLQREQMEKAR